MRRRIKPKPDPTAPLGRHRHAAEYIGIYTGEHRGRTVVVAISLGTFIDTPEARDYCERVCPPDFSDLRPYKTVRRAEARSVFADTENLLLGRLALELVQPPIVANPFRKAG